MANTVQDTHAPESETAAEYSKQCESDTLQFKRRMLEWPNPVEYVNNMYGCHPDDGGTDYFRKVFAK